MSNDKLVVCCDCKEDINYEEYREGTGYLDMEGYLVGFKCIDESVICDVCYAKDSESR